MSEPIKLCPFCGSEAELTDLEFSEVQIICSSCGARTLQAYKLAFDKIIDSWNNRSQNDAVYGDLKACPFCGDQGKVHRYKDTFIVQCSNCSCGTDYFKALDEAKTAWNNRAV